MDPMGFMQFWKSFFVWGLSHQWIWNFPTIIALIIVTNDFFFSTSVWSEYGICNLSVYDTVYLNLEAERNTVAGTASVIGLWTCWTNQDSQNNTAKSGFNSHGKDSVKYPWNMSSRREKLKHGKGHNNTFFLVSALFIGSYSEYGVQSSVNEHFVFK